MKKTILLMMIFLCVSVFASEKYSREDYEITFPDYEVQPVNSKDLVKYSDFLYKIQDLRNYTKEYVVDDILFRKTNCVNVIGKYVKRVREDVYYCEADDVFRNCNAGVRSGPNGRTRCYDYEGQHWWDADYCKEGWILQ